MLNNKIKLLLAFVLFAAGVHAQIGYQVALLNTATGKPRANVTVNAEVTITNAQNEVVHSSTQKVTSNDFGVLSLTVGDADTFQNTDTGKLPFYIAVKVDDVLIGKSQILSVPIAEVAKTLKSSFTIDDLLGEWKGVSIYNSNSFTENLSYIFNSDGTLKWIYHSDWKDETSVMKYEIEGNNIYLYETGMNPVHERLRYFNGVLWSPTSDFTTFHKISTP